MGDKQSQREASRQSVQQQIMGNRQSQREVSQQRVQQQIMGDRQSQREESQQRVQQQIMGDRQSQREDSMLNLFLQREYTTIEQKMEENYLKALGQGRVKVAYGRVMILGPGGVGKSSLLSGLMNKQLLEEANSTQVAEINTFQPGRGSHREAASLVARSGEIAEGYWTPVTEDDEMNELVGLVNLVYNVSSGRITSSRVFQGISSVAASTSSVNVSAASKIIAEVIELAKQYPDIQAPESEVFLYVWDCGGQQVFYSILSAFLTSKSMFFLMFDARYPLHDRFVSLSHHHGNVTEHIEEMTTAELLLQWMSCIHATLTEDEPSTTIPQYPCILPVGTHGDDPRVKKDKDGILEQLFDEYKNRSCAHLIPEKGFIIDNTTAGKGSLEDPGYKMILKRVHNFASNKIANVDTPVSWVLFRKVMKILSKGQPYFSMEDVTEIAEACMIPRYSVPSVLKFYHDLAVFFHYTNIPSLKHLVIANPQWLVRQIAKLLALKDFEESAAPPHLWEIFRRNGILVEALYTEVLKAPEGDEKSAFLSPQAIVDLLEYFLILAPVDTRSKVHTLKGKEYFVPSVLPPLLSFEDQTPATPRESTKKAASLHVIFPSVNYLPPGYFTRLATMLSKEPGFSLAFGQGIYRNKVSFVMGEPSSQIDTLTISEHKYSVEIEVRREAPRKRGNPLFSEVCLNLITTIEKSSIDICQWLPRIKTAFGFSCDKCKDSSKHFVLLNPEFTTESKVRCQRDMTYTFHGNQKFWLKVEDIWFTVPLSDAEIAATAMEVEFDQLKDLLEMTEHKEVDPVELIKRWIKEMREIDIPPRPYLIHYLKFIDMHEIAERIKYEEISTAPTSNSKNLESKDQDKDAREFSKDLSSGDLYRYLLFNNVPRKDCDIIRGKAISGLCFLSLSIKYWENCGVSEPGVTVIMKLKTDITPNPSPHVPALDYQAYLSSLSPRVLEQQLDHEGVVDLNEIADHMSDWEDRLSARLGLTRIAISDIKKIHLHQPPLQRREALKRWRNRCGICATYENLLMLCLDAGHTECAEVIFGILKRKDAREFSKDLSSEDLYRYLLFNNVPRRDCDIIKEREISGLRFLGLSTKYWENRGVSKPGIILITKLLDKIKATQTIITPNPSPHVPALDYQAYMSSLSSCVHPLLEKLLDWDHGGVDVNLNEIADHMLDWEDRLSAHLGLTRIDVKDIKNIYLLQPPLQRREALKRWKNRCGLHATYGNLLKFCVEAGHTECAQVICDILKRKGDGPTQFDSTSDRPTQFDSAGGIYHNTAHGVVITIPEGAIPENLVIKLDVKVTLTSTLKLPEDYRSVSPITELCIKNDPQFKFLKPIEVILPHFLDINDHETLPICFMKAEHGSDHFKHLDKNQEQSFDYHNYATLKTNHLCHLCIAAGKTEVRDKFNLIRVIPQVRPASGWSMYFYVIYDLPTCKSAINEHYKNREEIVSCGAFKFNDHLEIIYDENLPKGWILACASSKQVYKDSVHYDEFDEEDLKERCDKELYPPRFIINVIGKTDDPIRTTFTFRGANRELQSRVILTKNVSWCSRISRKLALPLFILFFCVICFNGAGVVVDQVCKTRTLIPSPLGAIIDPFCKTWTPSPSPRESVHQVWKTEFIINNKNHLFEATEEISDWFKLCTSLEVSEAVMNYLKETTEKNSYKRRDCLTHYYKRIRPLWNEVVWVIAELLENGRLACKIARNHMQLKEEDCTLAFSNRPRTNIYSLSLNNSE